MNEILILLRALIQDIDAVTYTDDQLTRLIVTSAIIVQHEIELDTDYTVNIALLTITPDPDDNTFILFTAYKAAILLLQAEIRTNSSQSIKIVDGPSTIDLSNRVKDLKSLLDTLISQYEKMQKDYTVTRNIGQCVITPTTVNYISVSEF